MNKFKIGESVRLLEFSKHHGPGFVDGMEIYINKTAIIRDIIIISKTDIRYTLVGVCFTWSEEGIEPITKPDYTTFTLNVSFDFEGEKWSGTYEVEALNLADAKRNLTNHIDEDEVPYITSIKQI